MQKLDTIQYDPENQSKFFIQLDDPSKDESKSSIMRKTFQA